MLIHAMTWMGLKNKILSKRSQTEKITLYDSIYMKHPEKKKPIETGVASSCLELGRQGGMETRINQ